MSIRKNNVSDIQACLFELLDSFTSTPWSNWDVEYGYPDEEVIIAASKAIVYVETPLLAGADQYQFGGGEPLNEWSCRIGFWVSLDKGGREEAGTFAAAMTTLVQTKSALYGYTFTVEIADVTYPDTTLKAQGVWLNTISIQPAIVDRDKNDYRIETLISITA